MRELMRSNDLVLISWVLTYLNDAGIGAQLFDANVSVMEGSIGAIPRRVMVPDAERDRAREMLDEAGIGYVE